MMENTPDIWLAEFPQPTKDGHKYHRGHAVIMAAPDFDRRNPTCRIGLFTNWGRAGNGAGA